MPQSKKGGQKEGHYFREDAVQYFVGLSHTPYLPLNIEHSNYFLGTDSVHSVQYSVLVQYVAVTKHKP